MTKPGYTPVRTAGATTPRCNKTHVNTTLIAAASETSPAALLKRRPGEPEPLGTDGGCQRLPDDRPSRFFCGHPVYGSSSYCPHHFFRAHNPPEKAKPSDAGFFGFAPTAAVLEKNTDAALRAIERRA